MTLIEAECALHADVLMINHVHLSLTPNYAVAVPKLVIRTGVARANREARQNEVNHE